MEPKPLGIAIIGAGAIADVHIQAYLKFPELCRVRAVCDLYPQKAQELIDRYGPDAQACEDYHQALEREDIDAVSICLPPSAHAQTAVDALDGGKHVLCEKPMAGSLEECDLMLDAARRNGRLLSIVAQNRYKTPNQKVKRLLEEGAIGPVLMGVVNSLWWRGENYYDLWWRGTWEKESGGCVTNHAVHHLDLLLWMMGMPQWVSAVIANLGHSNSQCEDAAVAVLGYPGAMVQFNANLLTHDEAQELQFQGRKGGIGVPWRASASKALPNGFPEPDAQQADALNQRYKELPDLTLEGHPAQVENFLQAIRGEATLEIDGLQGRNTMELIAAIYKSARTGRRVELPISTQDVFYKKGGIAATMPHFHEKTKSVENFQPTKPISLGRDVGR